MRWGAPPLKKSNVLFINYVIFLNFFGTPSPPPLQQKRMIIEETDQLGKISKK